MNFLSSTVFPPCILLLIIQCYVTSTTAPKTQYDSATIFVNKSSVGGLVGQPNNAAFGKTFYFQADTIQHIAYGHGQENYDFSYWFGKVYCENGFDADCDPRSCPVGGGQAYCDKKEKKPYCKCKYPSGSIYYNNCDPPKMVLNITNYYYGKGGSLDKATKIRTLNFVTTCKFPPGETDVPEEPEPIIITSTPAILGGDEGLNITISLTQYVHVPGMPVYFWLVNSISIVVNYTNLAAILEKIGTQNLGEIMSKQFVNEIVKLQNSNKN